MALWGNDRIIRDLRVEIADLKDDLGEAWRRNGQLEERLEWQKIFGRINLDLAFLLKGQERIGEQMATLQELQDALAEQNEAILAEVVQINEALANAKGVPQSVVDAVKAHTATIKGIVEDPLPPVNGEPPPPADPTPFVNPFPAEEPK